MAIWICGVKIGLLTGLFTGVRYSNTTHRIAQTRLAALPSHNKLAVPPQPLPLHIKPRFVPKHEDGISESTGGHRRMCHLPIWFPISEVEKLGTTLHLRCKPDMLPSGPVARMRSDVKHTYANQGPTYFWNKHLDLGHTRCRRKYSTTLGMHWHSLWINNRLNPVREVMSYAESAASKSLVIYSMLV